MTQLAVCAEMVFLDRPLIERVRALDDAGFAAVIWDLSKHDVDALARSGARFSSMTGYLRGTLTDAEGADELLRTAQQATKTAEKLNCPRLNLHGTGLDAQGLPVHPSHATTGPMWLTAFQTLSRIAELGQQAGVTFMLENLNAAVDHPGVPFGRAADTLALVEAVNSPGLRMNLDLYHAQIGEGNLIELTRRAVGAGLVAEVQVADVPGRCEPGTGEINYPAIAQVLADVGYDGSIAMEAWASGDDHLAIERFRQAFAPSPNL
ncbi:TIM barrel protein [Hoyosella altamirensis]|uniref:Hydroxypyruvate isomerase n=1 Tax=Hoyosella altamirensis TaxID=616997 RepID=A0A839RK96_9ACTN|nr:TIM barrel protein [Hoyosella altamirensis]MBB3036880.1 hydroxypyruvate isomerase [Hoyosella altamirensis]